MSSWRRSNQAEGRVGWKDPDTGKTWHVWGPKRESVTGAYGVSKGESRRR